MTGFCLALHLGFEGLEQLGHLKLRGERAGVRRKPAPDMVEIALQELGVEKDEAVYVGDSDVDVATAACGASVYFCIMGFPRPGFLGTKRGRPFLRTALLIYLVLLESISRL